MKNWALCLLLICGSIRSWAGLSSNLEPESLSICNAGVFHIQDASLAGTDQLNISYEDSHYPMSDENHFRSRNLVAQPNSTWQNHSPLETPWQEKITSSHFNFSTEKYGAHFFLDLCYQGPLATVTSEANTSDETEGIYNLSLRIGLREEHSSSGLSYRQSSSLATQAEIFCDLRAVGNFRGSRSAGSTGPDAIENDSHYVSDLIPWSSQQLSLDVALNNNYKSVARYCRIRLSFIERATSVLRDSHLNLNEVDLYLSIEKIQY